MWGVNEIRRSELILQFLNNSPSSLGFIFFNSHMRKQQEMDLPRYVVLDLTAETTGLGETPAKTLSHVVFPLVLRIISHEPVIPKLSQSSNSGWAEVALLSLLAKPSPRGPD